MSAAGIVSSVAGLTDGDITGRDLLGTVAQIPVAGTVVGLVSSVAGIFGLDLGAKLDRLMMSSMEKRAGTWPDQLRWMFMDGLSPVLAIQAMAETGGDAVALHRWRDERGTRVRTGADVVPGDLPGMPWGGGEHCGRYWLWLAVVHGIMQQSKLVQLTAETQGYDCTPWSGLTAGQRAQLLQLASGLERRDAGALSLLTSLQAEMGEVVSVDDVRAVLAALPAPAGSTATATAAIAPDSSRPDTPGWLLPAGIAAAAAFGVALIAFRG